jgi:hypothetical protein
MASSSPPMPGSLETAPMSIAGWWPMTSATSILRPWSRRARRM